MPKSVRIIDDFLPPDVFAAQKLESENAPYGKAAVYGHEYPGIFKDLESDPAPLFARHGMDIRLQTQVFRIYEKGAVQKTFIHWDTGFAPYSAVLSLADQDRNNGQFAFWRHKETGWEEVDVEASAGVALTDADGMVEDRWELVQLIELPPNRCIVFSNRLFHSRYPKDWQERWPRRIKVFIFDLGDSAQLDPA